METHMETEGCWHILLGQGLLSHSHGLVGNGKKSGICRIIQGLGLTDCKRQTETSTSVGMVQWCRGYY